MKKILFLVFAIFISTPLLAMDVTITVLDENNEPAIGASISVVGTNQGVSVGTNGQPDTNIKLSNVPDGSQIRISYIGYTEQTLPAQPTMSVKLEQSSINLNEVTTTACSLANGIKTVKCENCQDSDQCTPANCSGTCVTTACHEPCYKLKNNQCVLQQTDGGVFTFLNKQCTLNCMSILGYAPDPQDQWKCTQDCKASITDRNVKTAKYRGSSNPNNVKCEIIECKGNYHPSDDKQSCVPDQGDCTPQQLADIHASEGYLITQQNKCVPKKCLEPQYRKEGSGDNAQCIDQVGKQCNAKHATSAKYEMRDGQLVCVVSQCDTSKGYTISSDQKSCIKDCLSTAQETEPLATKAEYDSQMNCKIQKCAKKDGKKYIPSDDGKRCEETERDCDKTRDANIWPEHATAAGYKKSKTGGTAKCVATECESGYELKGGKCESVDDSDCDKKPENSKKSHRYYDASTSQTLCLIDECKDGYKVTNDMLSCIPESALSQEDAQKRMDELKENAQKMKEKEQSTPNKLLGAAGIGAVGIGGMNIASALSEQSADRHAEDDMKAYLATFRCDYGQGRNIVGGETGIQLPGGNELIQYTTEYKQLATSLKSDKEALGMLPGIESETIFDSATTGLYDDVSIGRQKGAFTSLSRALLDENSADAAEWQKMKDDTAKKLKTGVIVAGAGAVATIAGNIAINHGKGDQSGNILDKWEPQKQEIQDITLERVPCSNFEGTTGKGYKPNCECADTNAYFAENQGKCISCGTNERVNDTKNGCVCIDGHHRDDNNNCIANVVPPKCGDYTANGTTGTGEYPICPCTDTNAEFNSETNKCECKAGYSNPNGGQCLPTCVGLHGVDGATAHRYNVPNCPCEYSGATFDATRNECTCPSGQHEENVNGQKKCVTPPPAGTPCNSISGTTGTGMIPQCQCSDTNKTFTLENGTYKCKCKDGFREDAAGKCVSGSDPVFAGRFKASEAFDLGAYEISSSKCTAIINRIRSDGNYTRNSTASGLLYICTTGHTDTAWFNGVSGDDANRRKNQELSENRAGAMYDCINGHIRTLFPNATAAGSRTTNAVGKNWTDCSVKESNTPTEDCRKVELIIQTTPCNN